MGSLSVIEFRRLLKEFEADEEAQIELIRLRCATDLQLFAFVFFPHYCRFPFNLFHLDYFKCAKFGERGIRRARGAPRGSAKSTLVALIKPIHDLCYGLEKYVIVISNTEAQAAGKIRDIRTELLKNAFLIRVYGIKFPRTSVAETKFEAFAGSHTCRFEAYGAGTQIRGIRAGEARPSKIICDDVEHSEEVFNESLREKYQTWFREDVSKVGDETTNIEFDGTILHRASLLKTVMDNPMYESKLFKAVIHWSERQDLWQQWEKLLCNIDDEQRLAKSEEFYKSNESEMLKGTQVMWPEKEPYLYLMKERLEIGHRAFMKEKQNEPLGAEDKVFQRLSWYYETEQDGVRGVFIEATKVFVPMSRMRAYGAMDPSTGQTKAKKGKKGDFTCILTGLSDQKGRMFVHRDWTQRKPPSEYIKAIFEHHDEFEYEKFGVETNLYRNLLLPNIQAERARLELERKKRLNLPLYDIETIDNKEKRIYTLEPKTNYGWILFNRALSQEFKNQVDDFPHADHDDCPDTLEMLWGMVNNRYKMTAVSINAMGGR